MVAYCRAYDDVSEALAVANKRNEYSTNVYGVGREHAHYYVVAHEQEEEDVA